MQRVELEKQTGQKGHSAADDLSPQVKIYNRNFYLRNARFQDLQEQVDRQIHELASKPKLTPNSYIILVQKLQQKLNQHYQTHMNNADSLEFQDFQSIINKIGKFNNLQKEHEQYEIEVLTTQLWLLLINYDLKLALVPKNKITSLVHILFCPYMLKHQEMVVLLDQAFPYSEENRLQYVAEYPQASEEVLNSDSLVKLWLKIKKTHLSSFADSKKQPQSQVQLSFKPQINPKSKEYAKRELQKYLQSNRLDNVKHSKLNQLSGYISKGSELSYHQLLYKRTLGKQQILKTNRQRIPAKQKQKTMSCQQTKKLISNLYMIKEKKDDIDFSRIKEDEQLKLCTFHPQTIDYHKRSTTPKVRNYNKQIDRLEEGRKKKEKKQQAYENLGRVRCKNPGPPPSMVQRQKPRLILEIKVGDRVVQLKLKGDEQPRIVAKKFVIKYDLQQTMQEVLQSVIEQQLAAL